MLQEGIAERVASTEYNVVHIVQMRSIGKTNAAALGIQATDLLLQSDAGMVERFPSKGRDRIASDGRVDRRLRDVEDFMDDLMRGYRRPHDHDSLVLLP